MRPWCVLGKLWVRYAPATVTFEQETSAKAEEFHESVPSLMMVTSYALRTRSVMLLRETAGAPPIAGMMYVPGLIVIARSPLS